MSMMRLKSAAVAAVVGAVCLVPVHSQAALIVTETTDFSSVGSTFVGTLMEGTNTISGSLAGDCKVIPGFGMIDCNPASGGDTQDSILLDLPTNLELASASLTISNFTGPAGMLLRLIARNAGGDSLFNGSVLAEDSTVPLSLSVIDPGGITSRLRLSVFGGRADATGDFAVDWQIALTARSITAAPLSAPATLSLLGLGVLGLGIAHRRRQRHGAQLAV